MFPLPSTSTPSSRSGESDWPIARTKQLRAYLAAGESGAGTLQAQAPASVRDIDYAVDPTVGVMAGLWDPTGTGVGLPLDQSSDDARSMQFTGEPLAEALEITGSPEATVHLAVEGREDVHVVVKLCDVAPDGRSALVTTGWHRLPARGSGNGGEHAAIEVRVPLWATSYVVPEGHRLRVSVSGGDFPRIWPTRSNPRMRLATGGHTASAISLPTVPPAETPAPAIPAPSRHCPTTTTCTSPASRARAITCVRVPV